MRLEMLNIVDHKGYRKRLDPSGRVLTREDVLTPTESRVAQMVASGMSNLEIASELSVSEQTVKTHVTRILQVFKSYSRSEIIFGLVKNGYTTYDALSRMRDERYTT